MLKRNFLIFILFILTTIAHGQDLLTLRSDQLPRTDSILIFKPAGYSAHANYPVVYLLHGYSQTYKSWNKIIDCQSYADRYGFLIICPDGLYNSWYINSPVRQNSQFASFFFEELIPAIQKAYHTDPRNIFVTGLSMGGQGALHTQQGSSFIAMGVVGGAIFPMVMGRPANQSVAHAYYLPILCYAVIFLFAVRFSKIKTS